MQYPGKHVIVPIHTAILCLALAIPFRPLAQAPPCNAKDIYSAPGQTVVKPGGQGTQWTRVEPLRKELQRLLPQPIQGLHATESIAFGGAGQPWDEGKASPRVYDVYMMLKKFECNRSTGKFIPEGETGCWAYFTANSFDNSKTDIPGRTDIPFHGYYSALYLCDIREERDANGNRVLYYNAGGQQNIRWGIYISAKEKLPARKITREELIRSYRHVRDSILDNEIQKQQTMLDKDKQRYAGMTDAQKKEENYWPDLFQKWETRLRELRAEKSSLGSWCQSQLSLPNRKDEARITVLANYTDLSSFQQHIDKGYSVYIYDKDFFDYTKPIDAPQYFFVWSRRQDFDPPKKAYMDRLYRQFNLDVLYTLVGAAPRKPGGINTIDGSLNDAKAETVNAQGSAGAKLNYSLDAAAEGSAPPNWQAKPSYKVGTFDGKKAIVLDREGFIYPQQRNREIKDGFRLSFDLSWPDNISYYSPLLVLSIGDMVYDNTRQAYVDQTADMTYLMANATEGNGRSRISLRFDPYFNNGGNLDYYVFDAATRTMIRKNMLLPKFYRGQNKHRIVVAREGNHLVITDNGAPLARLENVFAPGTRYNMFTFGLYPTGGNAEAGDQFFLSGVSVDYGQ